MSCRRLGKNLGRMCRKARRPARPGGELSEASQPGAAGSAGTPIFVANVPTSATVPSSSTTSAVATNLLLFPKRILDDLGPIGIGITAPRRVRAEDSLLYVAKNEIPGAPQTVRASEFLWLSIARLIHLPATVPEVLEDRTGTVFVGTRFQPNVIVADNLVLLASGKMHGAREQLVRILAFDLFSGNGDRHPGNYLVLAEGGEHVLHAIDFSHVAAHPGMAQPFGDPTVSNRCATRAFFPIMSASYGCGPAPGIEIINRLSALSGAHIEAILGGMPADWLSSGDRQAVVDWWDSPAKSARAQQIVQGFNNGTYL